MTHSLFVGLARPCIVSNSLIEGSLARYADIFVPPAIGSLSIVKYSVVNDEATATSCDMCGLGLHQMRWLEGSKSWISIAIFESDLEKYRGMDESPMVELPYTVGVSVWINAVCEVWVMAAAVASEIASIDKSIILDGEKKWSGMVSSKYETYMYNLNIERCGGTGKRDRSNK